MKLTQERNSNIETLRIIAMFFILIGHANSLAFGLPSEIEIQKEPLTSFGRILINSICLGGVDIFILISGWFGIHPTRIGFFKILFQILFLIWICYFFAIGIGEIQFDLSHIKTNFTITKNYWFVVGYIGLYLLSPILNSFCETATKKQFQRMLVAFYCYQCFYSWGFSYVNYFEGYSIIFFIGLYLTARYFKLYSPLQQITKKHALLIYNTIILTLASVSFITLFILGHAARLLRYDNPLVILAALSLLLYFSNLSLKNKFINWVAASSFAVYLIHFNPFLFHAFLKGVYFCHSQFDGVLFLAFITLFLVLIYTSCILVDQIRIFIWQIFFIPFSLKKKNKSKKRALHPNTNK